MNSNTPTVAELFAGVGGFRLGLEGAPKGLRRHPQLRGSGWSVVWSNQWEPGKSAQHASKCYVSWFGDEAHENADIAAVLDEVEEGTRELPSHDLLVGGFPCQDYSVAKTLGLARGLEGAKGALWWQIHRLLRLQIESGRPPKLLFFENVDRLLSSPAAYRGRDFAVILASLNDLGYAVEWRVVNAADYGFPQRRKRVFIVGTLLGREVTQDISPVLHCTKAGALARAFPAEEFDSLEPWDENVPDIHLGDGPLENIGTEFTSDKSRFRNAGFSIDRRCWTRVVRPLREQVSPLMSVLQEESEVPERYFLAPGELDRWRTLKDSKRVPRVAQNGFRYEFSEGRVAFPDSLDKPSRTITTGEGGAGASRLRHVVEATEGRPRRLTAVELERLNGFPDNWTAGMTDGQRGFMMGNAIVVGLVQRLGRELREDLRVRWQA